MDLHPSAQSHEIYQGVSAKSLKGSLTVLSLFRMPACVHEKLSQPLIAMTAELRPFQLGNKDIIDTSGIQCFDLYRFHDFTITLQIYSQLL